MRTTVPWFLCGCALAGLFVEVEEALVVGDPAGPGDGEGAGVGVEGVEEVVGGLGGGGGGDSEER